MYPSRLLHPWYFPGKSTGVGCHFLLQGIFPTQGSNPGLPPYRQMEGEDYSCILLRKTEEVCKDGDIEDKSVMVAFHEGQG